MEISVEASNLQKETRYKEPIKEQRIGTEKEVSIKITKSQNALQTGEAIRLMIKKKDTKGIITSKRIMIDDLNQVIEPYYIYDKEYELGISDIFYESIDISIGLVRYKEFSRQFPQDNTRIEVQYADTKEILSKGDLVELDQDVIVTITPLAGYTITGRKVSDNRYQEKMKYSEYEKKISTIVKNHPVKPVSQ